MKMEMRMERTRIEGEFGIEIRIEIGMRIGECHLGVRHDDNHDHLDAERR